jgi:hypothetical protein
MRSRPRRPLKLKCSKRKKEGRCNKKQQTVHTGVIIILVTSVKELRTFNKGINRREITYKLQ